MKYFPPVFGVSFYLIKSLLGNGNVNFNILIFIDHFFYGGMY